MVNAEKIRNIQIQIVNKLLTLDETATSAVFDHTADLNRYAFRFQQFYQVEMADKALCGWEITFAKGNESITLCPCILLEEGVPNDGFDIIWNFEGLEEVVHFKDDDVGQNLQQIDFMVENVKKHLNELIKPHEWKILILSKIYAGRLYTISVAADTMGEAIKTAMCNHSSSSNLETVDIYGSLSLNGKYAEEYLSTERCEMDGYKRMFSDCEYVYYKEDNDTFAIIAG